MAAFGSPAGCLLFSARHFELAQRCVSCVASAHLGRSRSLRVEREGKGGCCCRTRHHGEAANMVGVVSPVDSFTRSLCACAREVCTRAALCLFAPPSWSQARRVMCRGSRPCRACSHARRPHTVIVVVPGPCTAREQVEQRNDAPLKTATRGRVCTLSQQARSSLYPLLYFNSFLSPLGHFLPFLFVAVRNVRASFLWELLSEQGRGNVIQSI